MDDSFTSINSQAAKVCFSYVRFSSRIQAKGVSERRQGEIAPRVAKEKGWILRDDLCAESLGFSAYKGSNLETIESIIEAAKSGKIPKGSVMILEALDRLTRITLDDAYQLFRRLLMAGIEIYTDRSGRHMTVADLNNPMSLMMTVVELDAAFQYSDKLADRVGKAWKNKKARAADGVKMTTMAPAWVDVDRQNNATKPNAKAAIVQRIFNSYADGKGIRAIVRELNAENVPAFGKGAQNKTGGWSTTHLRRLLGFRGVLGEYQPCNYEGRKRVPAGAPIPDYYPEVVDKTTFYKVQEILGKQTRKGGCKRNATNLFTGLVKCAKCGAAMHIIHKPAQHGKYNYTYLVCSDAMRGKGCEYAKLHYSWLESAVLSALWVKVLPAMAGNDTRRDDLAKLQGELKDAQAKIKIWTEAIDSGEAKPAAAMQKLNAYETRQAALTRQIESLSATMNDNPLTGWQPVEKTIDNRLRLQEILANEIEGIAIDAGSLRAALELKAKHEHTTRFELAWERTGANHVRKERAKTEFLLDGQREAYLDEVLIWKSERNILKAGQQIQIEAVDVDRSLLFGVDLGNNQIGVLA